MASPRIIKEKKMEKEQFKIKDLEAMQGDESKKNQEEIIKGAVSWLNAVGWRRA